MSALFRTAWLILVFASGWVVAANQDQAADDACTCAQEPYAQMERLKDVLQQAMESGDYSQLVKLEGDFAGLQDRAMSCYNSLKAKYPEIDNSPQLQDEVIARMQQKCPAPQFGFGPPAQ
jgi:hypothetical protein